MSHGHQPGKTGQNIQANGQYGKHHGDIRHMQNIIVDAGKRQENCQRQNDPDSGALIDSLRRIQIIFHFHNRSPLRPFGYPSCP